jgi:TPR repeat protein
MNLCLVFTILTIWSVTQVALPEKIQNIEDLKKLAEEGDSNAQCLLGLQEMIGGDLYDPRIIDTVTVEQILLNKLEKWRDQIRFLPSLEEGSEFETGSKTEDAFKWVQKSAQQGNKIALYCLGIFYGRGMGVKKDYDQAYKNFEKSAALGFPKSYKGLSALSAVKNDQKQAADWLWRGYDAGDLDCKVEVGNMFLWGLQVQKDEKKGFRHIEEAYEMGNKAAIGRLGDCYLHGLGTSKDLSKALALFKEGSDLNLRCKLRLGQMYLHGKGVERDEQKGLFLVEEVASTGNPEAKAYLGRVYANGWGVGVDNSKAVGLFEQAALNGSGDGMFGLGKAYYLGEGIQKNEPIAKSWLQKAKDRGSKEAGELLKKIEAEEKR